MPGYSMALNENLKYKTELILNCTATIYLPRKNC